jgi:co-chaperonin GroES (HSP10)
MARTFRVCTYRVLVKVKVEEEVTKSGIYIPPTVRERYDLASVEGTIVDMGPQAFKQFGDGGLQAQIGDQVKFAKFCGADFDEDGVKYRIMNDEDVLCVIIPDGEHNECDERDEREEHGERRDGQ